MPTIFSSRQVINVKDYGALGQDADYTTEIQAAINDIAAMYGYTQESVYIPNLFTLYFPPGRYRISSPIIMGGQLSGLRIAGDNALIRPTTTGSFIDTDPASPTYNQETYAFQHVWAYDVQMDGMHFAEFKKAVRFYKNYQIDSGKTKITNCTFQNNSEVALEVDFTSGQAIIEDCKFMENPIAITIGSDKAVIRDCWISNKNGMDGVHAAPIINYSRLTMESCMLVPQPPAGTCIEPAWINNYLSVTVKNTRQGGEPGSFTLVNNFGGVGNMYSGVTEPNSVTVRDSQCYAVYNNSGANTVTNYYQPAVLRYVNAIPNETVVESNCGLLYARLIGFSRYLYNDNSSAISNMIQASGASGLINSFNISVKVANNIGGTGWAPTGSLIPQELHPFVRDEAHLWPYVPSNGLTQLSHSVDPVTGAQVYTFAYPADRDYALLLNISGDPLTGGSAAYRGGYTGLLKSNGFWSNPGNIGEARHALVLKELFNEVGDNATGSWPGGTLGVEVVWEATGDRFLPNSNTNSNFQVRITGIDGYWDVIKVTPVNAL